MRGRKPRGLSLAAHDKSILEQIARSRTLPWFQVQHARLPVLEALLLAQPSGTDRAHRRRLARVQSALCSSFSLDLDQSENEKVV